MDFCKIKEAAHKDCAPSCTSFLGAYEACQGRIEKLVDDEKANCLGQYLEYIQCLDKCAAPKIFAQLK